MKAGITVITVSSFEDLRKAWGYNYPRVGDILTVSFITQHPNKQCRDKGISLLYFHEKPQLVGVCDKNVKGEYNFIEVMNQECKNSISEIKILEIYP